MFRVHKKWHPLELRVVHKDLEKSELMSGCSIDIIKHKSLIPDRWLTLCNKFVINSIITPNYLTTPLVIG
jgi:hypothetical protein